MKLTQHMIDAFNHNARRRTVRDSLQAVLDFLDPIPADVDKLHDRDRTCWRRSVDDPAVWTTAGRSRVATARTLLDIYGPVQWIGADGKIDFLVKMEHVDGQS